MVSNEITHVIFRCDASLEIGTGHVMRCLTLANALRLQGSVCRFVCKRFSGNLENRIQRDGFEVVSLPLPLAEIGKDQEESNLPKHFPWLGGRWQDDAEQTIAAIGPNKPSWLIVDHYGIDSRWEKFLRPHVEKIMVIDDLADRAHDCDLLLDQNLVANIDQRYEGLLPENSVRLIGPKYALLQPEYAELRKKAKVREGPVKRILVYFGGADNENLTLKAVKGVKSLKTSDLVIDVVISPKNPNSKQLRNEVKEKLNFRIHENLPTLADLIISADISIGGVGTTTWERCCLGLPSFVVAVADNQKPIYDEMVKENYVKEVSREEIGDEIRLSKKLEAVFTNENLKLMSKKCFSLVDGFGCKRVIRYLKNRAVIPRLANQSDEELLLVWSNDLKVRENSLSKTVIGVEEHKKWFKDKLNDVNNCIILIMLNPYQEPVGSIRFEKIEDNWRLSFLVAHKFRGKGYGLPIVEEGLEYLSTKSDKYTIKAEVLHNNLASLKIFKNLKFDEMRNGNLSVFRKQFVNF